MRLLLLVCLLVLNAAPFVSAQKKKTGATTAPSTPPPVEDVIAGRTQAMKRLDGFLPLYWDQMTGKLWLEVSQWNTDILYQVSLPAGVGSNDIGLDRGQLGSTRVVQFRKVGPKVLLVQRNLDYRASSADTLEQQAVAQSFAESVIWGFEAEAAQDNRVLVDATAFFLRDAHDVAGALRGSNQGSYNADASRSALYMPRTRNFPENTEIEATVTLSGSGAGAWLRSVTPTAGHVTVRQHHSFVKLPDLGSYHPRKFDPRAGFYAADWFDYSSPFTEPIRQQVICRHRLEKKVPGAAPSEAKEPIVYYLDPGTPEPIRTALMEGARWWNQAFEAAGYINAFQVKLLPADADPMDVRYSTVQWVHRSTRGWSYGASVVDPRTGEILKGHVTLGSLRVRQDYLIANALLPAHTDEIPSDGPQRELALARLRQLAAHEIGHTLGLVHNYYASAPGLTSVMDYPHPRFRLENGEVRMDNAYREGIGEWDRIAIRYGYSDFAGAEPEKADLDAILLEGIRNNLILISDADTRDPGGAHPYSHMWDNGADPAAELNRLMEVRRVALARFGQANLKKGMPWATLEEQLVPLYLLHRYQVEAVSKVVGGLDYRYAVKGDRQQLQTPVPDAQQKAALTGLIATLSPQALALPTALLDLIPPRPLGYPRDRENFRGRTGLTFDGLAPAEAAAGMVAQLLLHPARAERLMQQPARFRSTVGLETVLDALWKGTWQQAPVADPQQQNTQWMVRFVVLRQLIALSRDAKASDLVRARVASRLRDYKAQLAIWQNQTGDSVHKAYFAHAIALLEAAGKPEKAEATAEAPAAPPGAPIGMEDAWLLGCEE